ncbi:unnamed protein product, partial [Prorocentrum cordatum]
MPGCVARKSNLPYVIPVPGTSCAQLPPEGADAAGPLLVGCGAAPCSSALPACTWAPRGGGATGVFGVAFCLGVAWGRLRWRRPGSRKPATVLSAAGGSAVCLVDAPTHLEASSGPAWSIAGSLPLTLLPSAFGGQLAASPGSLGAPRAAGSAELAAGAARAALRVRFLYASPLVAGPGPANGKVMPPIRWQEESAAVQ